MTTICQLGPEHDVAVVSLNATSGATRSSERMRADTATPQSPVADRRRR